MIRSVFAVMTSVIGYSSIEGNRLYTSKEQAEKHCPENNSLLCYKVEEYTLFENDEDINRYEAAEAAASRLRNLREDEVQKEVNEYRDKMLRGEPIK